MSKVVAVTALAYENMERQLFTDLSFQLTKGEVIHLEGANGAGKTTLLEIIAGLKQPTSGHVNWLENNFHYVGHRLGLEPNLTVCENLHYFLRKRPKLSELEQIGLKDHQDFLVRRLSAGFKRRVALAKLYLLKKLVWLLDEPLTALDKTYQAQFISYIEQHVKLGGAVIMTHHGKMPKLSVPLKEVVL